MKKEYKIIFWAVLVILIFSAGYYLRTYIPLHKDLPISPFEAFKSSYNLTLLSRGPIRDMSEKIMRYPTSIILGRLLNPIFGNLYLIYILGAIIIFFLGREISGKNFGGFLAFSIYALSSENLLQFTRTICSSGLSYICIWASLLFLLRYFKNKKNYNLIIFIISAILALTSYHTGATAEIMILIGLLISLIYSSQLDKKTFFPILGIFVFYLLWIAIFDFSQLILIKNAVIEADYFKIFFLVFAGLLFLLFLFSTRNKKFWQSEYFPLILLIPSTILIFSKLNFFGSVLKLGIKNYYISPISLNNYIAQVLLTHSYIFFLLPILFKKELKPKYLVLRGWLIGLILISGGLIFEYYYARIFDYSFPLMFILFGLFWTKKEKFRVLVIAATIILLIISQLMIYKDPFTMRRYYNQEEAESAKKIINLNLEGKIFSDLRTSALFSYLGKKNIKYGISRDDSFLKSNKYDFHNTIFYEYENVSKLNIDYLILSESMRNIIYGSSFETTPVDDDFFKYYKNNFREIYNDGLMYVYEIKPK